MTIRDHLVNDASLAHKFWSVRISIFWAAVSGLYWAWPAFITYIPIYWYVGLSIFMSIAIVVARLMKQTGLPDD